MSNLSVPSHMLRTIRLRSHLSLDRAPAAKQERALVSWLNSHLSGLETDFDRSKGGVASIAAAHPAARSSSAPSKPPAGAASDHRSAQSPERGPPGPGGDLSPLGALEGGCDGDAAGVTGTLAGQKQQQRQGVLSLQRLSSQVRGALWRQYRGNKGILDAISKVFDKIDGGYFNMSEVRAAMETVVVLVCFDFFKLLQALRRKCLLFI